MGLNKVIFGIMIFAAVIITGVLTVGDLNQNYEDLSMDTERLDDIFVNSTSFANNTHTMSLSMKCALLGSKEECSVSDTGTAEERMFKGAFSAVRLIKGIFGMFGDVSEFVADLFNIPVALRGFIKAGFFIAVSYMIILIVFRIKG